MSLNFLTGDQGEVDPQCSRASCNNNATWKILWRNPKIHDQSRLKTWLACEDHKDYLAEYLKARSFPVTVKTFKENGVND